MHLCLWVLKMVTISNVRVNCNQKMQDLCGTWIWTISVCVFSHSCFLFCKVKNMPKGRKEKSAKSKIPYARPDKHDSTKITKTAPGASKSKEKTIKLKNERLADQLDELMVDLSAHLVPRKKSKKTTMETDSKVRRLLFTENCCGLLFLIYAPDKGESASGPARIRENTERHGGCSWTIDSSLIDPLINNTLTSWTSLSPPFVTLHLPWECSVLVPLL